MSSSTRATSSPRDLDPRLARPFLEGFSDSMDLVFLVGSGVMLVGFLVMLLLPHVELRSGSGYSERDREGAQSSQRRTCLRQQPGAAPSPRTSQYVLVVKACTTYADPTRTSARTTFSS